MKATINLEFTDQELTGFVERWANKVIASALSDLAGQVGPLVPVLRDVVMRAVAGSAPTQADSVNGRPSPDIARGGQPSESALVLYEAILHDLPAEQVAIVIQQVLDGSLNGDRILVPSKPRNAEELLAAVKAIHGPSVPPLGVMYAVRFYRDSKGIGAPLAEGWVMIAPDPPPSSAGG